MAGTTGLEPATSAVTGQRSNQLSYVPKVDFDYLDNKPLGSNVSRRVRRSVPTYRNFGLTLGVYAHEADTK